MIDLVNYSYHERIYSCGEDLCKKLQHIAFFYAGVFYHAQQKHYKGKEGYDYEEGSLR